jgi:hypothetical protein
MPELDRPVPGDPVEATWGELVAERVVSRYTSEASRDTAGPHEEGMVCFVLDINGLQVYDGSAWRSIAYLVDGTDILDADGVARLEFTPTDTYLKDGAGVNRLLVTGAGEVVAASGTDLKAGGGFIRMAESGKLKLGNLADPDIWTDPPMVVLDYGSLIVGTMGSFDGDVAYGWTRTTTGYAEWRQNASTRTDAQGLKFSADGAEILYQSNWPGTAVPLVRFRVNDAGPAMMVEDDSVAALAADVQNLVSVYGQLEPAVVASTPEEDDRPAYQSLPIREILADLLARVEALEA